MILISAAFTTMWGYLRRHPALVKPGRDTDLAHQTVKAAGAIGIYAVATGISFISAGAALAVFAAVAIAFAFNRLG